MIERPSEMDDDIIASDNALTLRLGAVLIDIVATRSLPREGCRRWWWRSLRSHTHGVVKQLIQRRLAAACLGNQRTIRNERCHCGRTYDEGVRVRALSLNAHSDGPLRA